jgi:hypothetical protein
VAKSLILSLSYRGWQRARESLVAGTLAAGQATGAYGLSAIMWLSATALLGIPLVAKFASYAEITSDFH